MPRTFAVCLVVVVALAGCQSMMPGDGLVVAEYPSAKMREMGYAPGDGTYALVETAKAREYRPGESVPEPAPASEPILRGMALAPRRGPMGFKRDGEGRLVAFAGEETIPLLEGNYAWHRTDDCKVDTWERPTDVESVARGAVAVPLTVMYYGCMLLGGGRR